MPTVPGSPNESRSPCRSDPGLVSNAPASSSSPPARLCGAPKVPPTMALGVSEELVEDDDDDEEDEEDEEDAPGPSNPRIESSTTPSPESTSYSTSSMSRRPVKVPSSPDRLNCNAFAIDSQRQRIFSAMMD